MHRAPPHRSRVASRAAAVIAAIRRLDGPDRIIIAGWVGTRLVVALAAVVATIVHRHFGLPETIQLHQGLQMWDGAFYADIARQGYEATGDSAVRFFPMLPLLMRAITVVVRSETVAGVLVANASALAAGLLTRRVARRAGLPDTTALLAAVMVVAGPTAFTTVLVYGEGLFLFSTALLWWAIDDDRPVVATLAGFVGALTRPVGVLLAIPALLEGWRHRGERGPVRALVPVLGPVAGLLLFLSWTAVVFDNFFAPFNRQTGLRGDASSPIRVVWDHLRDLFGEDSLGDGLHVPAIVILIGLAVAALRLLPLGWGLFGAVNVIVFLTAPNLNSVERYGGSTLPLIVAGAIVTHRWILRADLALVVAVGVSTALGVVLTTLAFLGIVVP